jgi:peptide/nickel transport system permease protein
MVVSAPFHPHAAAPAQDHKDPFEMLTFVARRLLISIPVLFLATVFVFFAVSIVGDPLATLRMQPNISQITLENITERKHLDRSLPVQYGFWLKEAVTDKFGTNLGNRPIWPNLRRALGHTLQLVIAAEVLALAIAIPLGVFSARKQYSFLDYTTTTISLVGFSVPIFWFALILQVIVTNFWEATGIRIFYTALLSSPNPGTGFSFLIDRLQHLALPIIALTYVSMALYSRFMRSSMLEVINSDYVRTARAKGVRERLVVRRHAVRNALIPIVTLAALNFGSALSGVIVTETVFALDGMGLFFIRALGRPDAYEVMAFLTLTSIFIIVANLVADILYGYLDPRIRYE